LNCSTLRCMFHWKGKQKALRTKKKEEQFTIPFALRRFAGVEKKTREREVLPFEKDVFPFLFGKEKGGTKGRGNPSLPFQLPKGGERGKKRKSGFFSYFLLEGGKTKKRKEKPE